MSGGGTVPQEHAETQPENGHYLEERVGVYLRWNDGAGQWELDGATVDGDPLFGYDNGIEDGNCECEDDHSDHASGHVQALRRAEKADLPDARELYSMLKTYYGTVLDQDLKSKYHDAILCYDREIREYRELVAYHAPDDVPPGAMANVVDARLVSAEQALGVARDVIDALSA